MNDANNKKSKVEATISEIVGAKVELTVRGLKSFTLSADGDVRAGLEKAKAFLSATGQVSGWVVEFDLECDQTCAWFDVTA